MVDPASYFVFSAVRATVGEKLKVRDVMTTDVVTVDKDDVVEHVLDLMRKHNVSKLPVLEKGKLVGVVTDGDIADELGAVRSRPVTPAKIHVSGVMRKSVPVVSPDADLAEVVKICKNEGVGLIPVASNGKLEGILTKADLLDLVRSTARVGDIMKRQLHAVSPDDRIVHARRIMMDHGIERLPVLEAGILKGIIAELDIAYAFDGLKRKVSVNHQAHHLKLMLVRDAMSPHVIAAHPEITARDAAALMREQDVGCLPIVGPNDKIQGMITRTDLIQLIPL